MNTVDSVMTTADLERIFQVDKHTIWRWEERGLIKAVRTVGGHRRYLVSDQTAELQEVLLRPAEELLTPGQVAKIFRVNVKTVSRWSRQGKLKAVLTLGGHRRFRASEVKAAIETTGLN
jgi:excisionase family DNA binding protein